MLTSHGDICIPPESRFFVELHSKYGTTPDLRNRIKNFLRDLYDDEKFTEWGIEKERLHHRLTSLRPIDYSTAVSTVYRTYMEQFFPEAKIWGDKNPEYLYHTDVILEYFPQARLIHIVRDIRAIYASLAAINRDVETKTLWKSSQPPLFLATRQWSQALKVFEKYKAHKQFYTINYETLILSPERQLADLCSWLGVEFRSSMLLFYQTNAEKQLVPPHRLKWHERTLQPITADRIGNWQNEISATEINAVELMNRKAMTAFGYDHPTRSIGYKALQRIAFDWLRLRFQQHRKQISRLRARIW